MKKSYLIIVAAVALFTACQDTDNFKEAANEANNSAIAFASYAGIQTKAGAENSGVESKWDLENHSTTFNVWAWKKYGNDWINVYDNGEVTYNPNGNKPDPYYKWDADPVVYWDKSAEKYIFYAAAPKNDSWEIKNETTNNYGDEYYLIYKDFTLEGGLSNNITATTGDKKFKYAESFIDVDDVDLMIAEDNEMLRARYNKTQADKVNELFDHILSRLNVTVSLKPNGNLATRTPAPEVYVTDFEISVMNLKNKGSFNENATITPDVLNQGTTKRWGAFSGENFTPGSLSNTTAAYANLEGVDISNEKLTTTALYIAQYLIMPQSITSELLDRAEPKTVDEYYTQTEIDNAVDGEDAFGKTTSDIKVQGGVDATHPYFVIKYKIDDEPYVAYYNLANAFGIEKNGTLAFNEGWQNTLNILIDADAIVFDAEVYQWKDVPENFTIK